MASDSAASAASSGSATAGRGARVIGGPQISRSPGSRRRSTLLTLGLLPAGAVLLVATAAPANAHADIREVTPADGSTIAAAPSAIELTFTEPLLEAAAKAVVTDETGAVVIKDRSTVSGDTLRIPWEPSLPDGVYTVSYRVVSGDGHPISGQASFTLDAPDAPSASPSPSPPAPPAPPASSGPTSAGATAAEPSAEPGAPVPDSPPTEEPMSLTDPKVLLGALIGTIGGIGIVILQRRRAR